MCSKTDKESVHPLDLKYGKEPKIPKDTQRKVLSSWNGAVDSDGELF